MKKTDFTFKVSRINCNTIPMVETNYYAWLDAQPKFDPNALNSLVKYIESLGFDIEKHFIASWCFKDLRYIHNAYFRNVDLKSLTTTPTDS